MRARGRIAEALDSGHFVVLPIPRQNLEQLVRVFRSEQGRLTDLMANQHVHSCRAVRKYVAGGKVDAIPVHTFSTTAGDRYFRSTLSIFDRVKVGLPIQQNELLTLQGVILQGKRYHKTDEATVTEAAALLPAAMNRTQRSAM